MAFQAETFDEMAELSKKHGMEMAEKNDAAHLAKMAEMRTLMENPEEMQAWFQSKKNEFEALPDNS